MVAPLGETTTGSLDGPDRAARELDRRAGGRQRRDEAGGGAVEARRFRAVEFDLAVVDPQPGQSGEKVFDERDTVLGRAERRAAGRSGHEVRAGGNGRRGRLVGATEDESACRARPAGNARGRGLR